MIAIFVKPAMSHHQSFLSYYILEDGHGAGFHCLSLTCSIDQLPFGYLT